MKRSHFIQLFGDKIIEQQRLAPLKIGIDGFSAAGKSTLAKELSQYLISKNCHVILSSIDHFHHPQKHRYTKGSLSPEGYYYDSFNYDALQECLLSPLSSNGNLVYQTHYFDHESNQKVPLIKQTAHSNSILIFEGIFLLVDILYPYWDLSMYLKIDYETYINRGLERHKKQFGSYGNLKEKYAKRYYPGQLLYLDEIQPTQKANFVIDHNDFTNPVLLKGNL